MQVRRAKDADYDCVVCGSFVLDLLAGPVSLTQPLGIDTLHPTGPLHLETGGIVSNAGTALARMGQRVAALSLVGHDDWGEIIRQRLAAEGVDVSYVRTHPDKPTSTTVVLSDRDGEHCFIHSQGAPKSIDAGFLLTHLELLQRSRVFLLGYYSLLPNLEHDLASVLAQIRQGGCLTAMDASGSGGAMQPLEQVLPHLDFYIPSLKEASTQTECTQPREMLESLRRHGAVGTLGVKLGARGALLLSPSDEWIEVAPVVPPGPVLDTTGAGDAFFAGLIAGVLQGESLGDAAAIGAAAGACCVTGRGAAAALRNYEQTRALLS